MVGYRRRSGLSQLAAVTGVLLGGGAFGALLGHTVAPDSGISVFVSGVMLPVAFFAGAISWLGTTVLFMAVELVRWLALRDRQRLAQARTREVPPGASAFQVASAVTSLLSAWVVSVLSTEASFLRTEGLYLLVGLIHGWAASTLARAGFIPVSDGS